MRIRSFPQQDLKSVLDHANSYAAFDGTLAEADLCPVDRFVNGFWVAEDEGRVVGFAHGLFKRIPEMVPEVEGEEGGLCSTNGSYCGSEKAGKSESLSW